MSLAIIQPPVDSLILRKRRLARFKRRACLRRLTGAGRVVGGGGDAFECVVMPAVAARATDSAFVRYTCVTNAMWASARVHYVCHSTLSLLTMLPNNCA